ncbi:MAG: hypothetical protein U0794_23325 [Isosphaeraceae bacterium]
MSLTRREWLAGTAAGRPLVARRFGRRGARGGRRALPIVDTHQHLRAGVPRQRLAWLGAAASVLRRSYTPDDYRDATAGSTSSALVYMEVDVEADQHEEEAAAIIGSAGRRARRPGPRSSGDDPPRPSLAPWVDAPRVIEEIRGVRQVLHGGSTPRGYCLSPEFVAGVRKLGEAGLCFDLCLPHPA